MDFPGSRKLIKNRSGKKEKSKKKWIKSVKWTKRVKFFDSSRTFHSFTNLKIHLNFSAIHIPSILKENVPFSLVKHFRLTFQGFQSCSHQATLSVAKIRRTTSWGDRKDSSLSIWLCHLRKAIWNCTLRHLFYSRLPKNHPPRGNVTWMTDLHLVYYSEITKI